MIISGDTKHFYHSAGALYRESAEAYRATRETAFREPIPTRYRGESDGIDLEVVRKDRQEARRQVVRAMLQSIANIWSRH